MMPGKFLRVDYEAIYEAWLAFRKGKKPSSAIDQFAYNLESDLRRLSDRLNRQTYKHGDYQKVVVREKKRRDLAVASVSDRVVHRLLYDYLLPKFDLSFDPDVWSCRKDKGLHKCLARTQQLLRKHSDYYIWRADITKFFDSVDQALLLTCLARRIGYDQMAMGLCQEVIDSYSLQPGRGIPIGNLTSQLFANIYLNEFDRFVRHNLKPRAYIRYGDDFVLFYPTRRRAYGARDVATTFLADHMKLTINPKNNVIIAASRGLKFLGHSVTADMIVVDAYTTKRVLERLVWRNASSYRALPLVKEARDGLDWILSAEYVDIN